MPRWIEHVIFDLDGTLVDTRADLANAVNHVRLQFALAPLDPTTLHRYVGNGARALIERAMGPELQARAEEATELFLTFYRAHLLEESCLYPGIDEVLAALRTAGVAASILTNKPEDLARLILRGLGVMDEFVDVVGGDRLPVRKPDPTGARQLLEKTGTQPTHAVLVGDSPVDSATAMAGGLHFCGVTWGFNPTALLAERTPVVQNATALGAVLLEDW